MNSHHSVSLLITSGNGPSECTQAVSGVLAHMREDAAQNALELDINETFAKHGTKSATLVVHGLGNDRFAHRWVGTIQWRSKSNLRPNHKRSNWFIGIFLLPHNGIKAVDIAPSDVMLEAFRAGGPGGQHQNTTDSAVRATHRPTGLSSVAREMRSQHRNRARALERLHLLMTAQAIADQDARKSEQNQLHHSLERGNPLRSFKGANFREEPTR